MPPAGSPAGPLREPARGRPRADRPRSVLAPRANLPVGLFSRVAAARADWSGTSQNSEGCAGSGACAVGTRRGEAAFVETSAPGSPRGLGAKVYPPLDATATARTSSNERLTAHSCRGSDRPRHRANPVPRGVAVRVRLPAGPSALQEPCWHGAPAHRASRAIAPSRAACRLSCPHTAPRRRRRQRQQATRAHRARRPRRRARTVAGPPPSLVSAVVRDSAEPVRTTVPARPAAARSMETAAGGRRLVTKAHQGPADELFAPGNQHRHTLGFPRRRLSELLEHLAQRPRLVQPLDGGDEPERLLLVGQAAAGVAPARPHCEERRTSSISRIGVVKTALGFAQPLLELGRHAGPSRAARRRPAFAR